MSRRAKRIALRMFAGLAFVSPVVCECALPDAQETEALWLVDRDNLVHKVRTLEIGDVNLRGVTIAQVLDFLNRQSRLHDPDHRGINFTAKHTPELDLMTVNLDIKHATIKSVLDSLPMLEADIGDSTVTVRMGGDEEYYSRTFNIPDNELAINPSMIADKQKRIYDVRRLFESKGVHFPPGSSALYELPAKTLTVVLPDQEQIIQIDKILVFDFKKT